MAEEDDLQKYLDTLNKEMEDPQEEIDEDGNLVLTITTQVDGNDDDNINEDDDGDECNNGTIIMDADGNYYFQTSDKMVAVTPIKKQTTPIKKVAATIVSPAKKFKKPGR